MKQLDGKQALVTGAYRGIGQAVAIALATAGAEVALADLQPASVTAQAIGDLGGGASVYTVNVASEMAVEALFSALRTTYDNLDIVVNCAGVIHEKPLLETRAAEFDRVIEVNLRGTFLIGRESIRWMVEHGTAGRVINIASDLAYLGRESYSAYVASKHGVLGLTRSWALEFGPDILVNAVCPGPVGTAMLSLENMSPEWREKEEAIPLGRIAVAEEIAPMVVFLAGSGANFITGQGIGVNGGSVMA